LPRVSFDSVRALAKAYIMPEKLHRAHDGLSPVHRDRLTREPAYASLLPSVRDVDEILVLVCGHGGRDARCGVMGPVLRREFEEKLAATDGFEVRTGPVQVDVFQEGLERVGVEESRTSTSAATKIGTRVGLISHIGGHKFAGNVIVYLPPNFKYNGKPHPLAGHGIWYGRVEPKHVEGIVQETIVKGNVVEDLFRGGIDSSRRILRI
jgi:hypothetical protein